MGLCAAGFVALLAAPLAGCGGNLEAALNANAAMRIDVQVYKGPLALEPDVQWAQLLGYLDEIDNGLTNYATGAKGRLAEAFLRVLGPALRGVYLERKDLPAEQSSQKLIADLKRLNDAVGRPSLCGNSTDKTSMAELIKVLEALQNIEPKSVTWEKGKDIIESFQNEARDIYRLAFLLKNACDMQGVIRQKLAEAVSFDAVFRGSPPAMYRHRPSGTCVAADPSCDDMRKLMEDLRDNVKRTREDFRRVLSGIVEASARFKANAKYWAFEHTVFNSDNREVRILQTSLQLIGAEYNRKVVTGANALIAQLDYADRRELPISAMLADSNPTAFVNQVFWSDAAGSRLNNFEAFSEDYVEDRVRALEALYEDDTWAKVNTV
jgi:hypothetical protein